MSVQIRGRQILDSTITAAKLVLSDDFDFSSGTVSVASPSSANHAASKSYVDSLIQGITWKEAVVVLSKSNVSVTSAPASIDGVTMSNKDRVLLVNQSTASENGIWVFSSSGSALSRADDADPYTELDGAAVFVKQGTSADEGFVQTATLSGYADQNWVQFSGAGNITAGNGLSKSGNTLSVNVDDSSIEINADTLRIKSGGVSNAMLANSSISIAGSDTALGGSISAATILGASDTDALSEGASNLYFSNARARSAISASDSSEIDFTYNSGTGVLTADLIDGSIANARLANSSVSFGGVSVALGSSSAQPAFDLTNATNYPTSSLSGTITNAQLAGSIANDKLSNSSVSLGGVSVSLGGTDATPAFDLSDATNYPASSLTGTIANSQIADDTIALAKVGYQAYIEAFSADGSSSTFDLARAIKVNLAKAFVVTVNGLVMDWKDSPTEKDEFKIDNTGASSYGRITFGANLDSGDKVVIRYIA